MMMILKAIFMRAAFSRVPRDWLGSRIAL